MIRGPVHHLFSLLVLAASVGASPQTPAQTAPSDGTSLVTFHWNIHQVAAPMKIVRIMLDDKEITLDTPVPVEGMWMRMISVTLLNASQKAIVVCGISIMFPETSGATNGPVPSIEMSRGKLPKHALMKRDGTVRTLEHFETEIQIPPGSLVTFRAPEGADIDQAEAYRLVNPISKVNIVLGTVFFSDESKWLAGKYYIAVPPPRLWEEASPADFFAAAPAPQP